MDEPPWVEPTGSLRHDSDYGSWAHQLDATAVWQPERQDWAGPPADDPPWPASRSLEAEAPAPPWSAELAPPPFGDATAAMGAPWEAEPSAAEPGFHSASELGFGPAGGLDQPSGDDAAAFAAAQAEARRLVEEAASQPWAAGPPWGGPDRSGADPFASGEPVVSFGQAPGHASPAPPAEPDAGTAGQPAPGPLPVPGPGRALEPAAPSWERPSPGQAEAGPATQRWDPVEQGGHKDWSWPAAGDPAAPTAGVPPAPRSEDGGVDDLSGRATTIDGPPVLRAESRSRTGQVEGRRARRQLEAGPRATQGDGRRARRQGGARARSRWLVRLVVLAWIVLFAVVCWLYIFPWLEGVLPENF
jgi:hypothetical protein